MANDEAIHPMDCRARLRRPRHDTVPVPQDRNSTFNRLAPTQPFAFAPFAMPTPASPPPATPSGDVVIRTIAMPAVANANGDIFGGWLVAQMDLGGAILARSTSMSRVTTVAIDAMSFIHPVCVGDTVSCYAQLVKVGRTSMKISVEAWVHSYTTQAEQRVTAGLFTYVAIDPEGKPRPVKR